MSKKVNTVKLDRYYLITRGFLMVTPLIAYIYLTIMSLMHSTTIKQLINQTPSLAVIFLASMLNPYISYLLGLIQKNFKAGKKTFACMNLCLLVISEAMTMNTLYFMMIAYLMYMTLKTYDIKMTKTLKDMTIKQMFYEGGGSFIVLAISMICLFTNIKLM